MGKVRELKEFYGNEQAKIINELAGLASRARQIDFTSISASTKERLSPEDFNRVRAAEQEEWASDERERAKAEYAKLDAEMAAAIEEARLEAEAELRPASVSPEAVLLASKMTEAELIEAMDGASTLGEPGEDTVKLLLNAARQREGAEMAIQHALQIMPELEDPYEDIVLASQERELGPEDTFEMFADQAPTKQQLLGAPQSDINVYNAMRQ